MRTLRIVPVMLLVLGGCAPPRPPEPPEPWQQACGGFHEPPVRCAEGTRYRYEDRACHALLESEDCYVGFRRDNMRGCVLDDPVAPFTLKPSMGAAPANVATARDLLFEGANTEAKGDAKQACSYYRRAASLLVVARIGFKLAWCDAQAGHLMVAARGYRRVGATDLGPNPDRDLLDMRRDALSAAAALESRTAKLFVRGVDNTLKGLVVAIDRKEAPLSALVGGLAVDPGTHLLVITAPGRAPFSRKITLVDEETMEMEVQFDEPALPERR